MHHARLASIVSRAYGPAALECHGEPRTLTEDVVAAAAGGSQHTRACVHLAGLSLGLGQRVGPVEGRLVLAMHGHVRGLADGRGALVLRVHGLGLVHGALVGPPVVRVRLGTLRLAIDLVGGGRGLAHVRKGEIGSATRRGKHARGVTAVVAGEADLVGVGCAESHCTHTTECTVIVGDGQSCFHHVVTLVFVI